MRLIILFLSFFYSVFVINAQVTADAGPDRKACVNDELKVTGIGLAPGDTGSYQWTDIDAGVISSQKVLIKKLTSVRQYTIELKVTRIHNGITYIDRDSFLLQVYGLPQISLPAPDTVCSSSSPVQLRSNYAANDTNGKWSEPYPWYITGSTFDPSQSRKSKQYEGPVKVYFSYTHPLTKCFGIDSLYKTVQTQPEVKITTTKPLQQCEFTLFYVDAVTKWISATVWNTSGDGNFTPNENVLKIVYKHGSQQDTAIHGAILTITTIKEGVCPQASDNIPLIIEPYPDVELLDPMIACEPATIDFTSNVSKPNGSPNLRYSWFFGNDDSLIRSTDGNPKGVMYKKSKEGWYDVKLKVHNQWGTGSGEECVTTIDSLDYVKVLPQPHADFISDPEFYTTVNNPTFNFINKTKIAWGKIDYTWNFDFAHNRNDTSSKANPSHTYPADTATYWVNLYTKYEYDENHFCEDSIGQLRMIGPPLSDMQVFTLVQNKSVAIGLPFDGKLTVIDATGRTIDSRNVKKGQREHYDVSDWPSATYFFVLENGKNRKVKKFVKF